jgi:hypothetical protein
MGYQGTVSTKNIEGKYIDTGIPVQSGIKRDDKGNIESNNAWMSPNYQNLMHLDKKQ